MRSTVDAGLQTSNVDAEVELDGATVENYRKTIANHTLRGF